MRVEGGGGGSLWSEGDVWGRGCVESGVSVVFRVCGGMAFEYRCVCVVCVCAVCVCVGRVYFLCVESVSVIMQGV